MSASQIYLRGRPYILAHTATVENGQDIMIAAGRDASPSFLVMVPFVQHVCKFRPTTPQLGNMRPGKLLQKFVRTQR